MKRRVFILFHGRFPSEKAAALFVAENAKSLAPYFEITILVPSRRRSGHTEAAIQYAFPESVKTVVVPSIDMFGIPLFTHVAFLLSIGTYIRSVRKFLKKHATPEDVILANDLLVGLNVAGLGRLAYEVHDYPEHWKRSYQKLFKRSTLVIATNKWKYDTLQKEFGTAISDKVLLLRNGVDVEEFERVPSREECRKKLSLPDDTKIVLYTGHFYSWKGTDTLAEAAKLVPEALFIFVGGTAEDLARMEKAYAEVPNIEFRGFVPHTEIPYWQRAADILVLPNTAKEDISAHYTSPMKLFEYMASGSPIVASNIPSITELIDDKSAYLVPPDSPEALAEGIRRATTDPGASAVAQKAQDMVREFSWKQRAHRFLTRLQEVSSDV